jgi:group II intron reverse transcriptase/maturase
MQPTTEILARIRANSTANKEEIFTKLYRYLLRSDLYFEAYMRLYANQGAATKGVDDDTVDGFSKAKIDSIIKSLKEGTYQPKPVRRTYIRKANGKMRPLGIPTFTDKLVQEVLRMILEAVYEPVFLGCSHGFRPERSCHTALLSIKKGFNGARWFIEGDIKGCFDNINHNVLVGLLNKKVKDARISQLVYRFLNAGYMENWQYHNTYSGAPQGGIISPLLANIYLHELDVYVAGLKAEFDQPSAQKYTFEYDRLRRRVETLRRYLKKGSGLRKQELLDELKVTRAEMLKTPAKAQTDKKIKYIRYADDFLIAVNGNREDCVEIKRKLTDFVGNTLKMKLSDEKTLITHSEEHARFLGYDVRVRRSGIVKGFVKKKHTRRSLSGSVELNVPFQDKIHEFLFNKGVVEQKEDGTLFPIHRPSLLHCTALEIIEVYNAELRGLCNYYSMASNFSQLKYFAYLMEYSCIKTLGAKFKCSIGHIKKRFKDGNGEWGIPYETKTGTKRRYFADFSDCKGTLRASDIIGNHETVSRHAVNTFEKRLNANVCELCGATNSDHYEFHHVNKLKNLKGLAAWEKAMIAKKRKTLVVCRDCHKEIHRG